MIAVIFLKGVTFSLRNTSDSAFSIDAASGEVTFSGSADSEGQSSYNFEVIATDVAGNSSEPLSVAVPVEEQGFEISSGSKVNADENIGENQPVYITEVLGTEQGDVITYSLPTSADVIGGFEQRFVKNDDGSITLQIYVSDTVSANYQDGIENFDLTLSYDISEISDVDLSVTSEATFSATNEIALVNYAIAALFFPNLYAIDSPLVELTFNLNADLASTSFTVSNGLINADSAYLDPSVSSFYYNNGFTVNETTGEVSLTENPDHETKIDYIFSVMATNTTTNETAVQSVNLQINDLDDSKPVITSGEIEVSVDENSGAQVIYTATADDSGDISDGFTFALTGSDASAFSIDEISGVVTLVVVPDFEAKSEYNFAVIAIDAAGNVSDPKELTLSVNNLDDTAPTVTSADDAGSVDENGSAQVVYSATADDGGDISEGVTFSLANDGDSAFSINAASGEVTFAGGADYEDKSEHSFRVIATDAAGNASDPYAVTLSVTNLDEVAPTINSGPDAISVDENGTAQVVYTATADDSGDFSEGVTFSLANDSDSAFSIDSVSGEVTFAGGADYEGKSEYIFSIIATDAAGNVSEPHAVSMQVTNVDEVGPSITSAFEADSIFENSGAGQMVYTASAVDTDFNNEEIIQYRLDDSSDDVFSINAETGEVTLNADPDYEVKPLIALL